MLNVAEQCHRFVQWAQTFQAIWVHTLFDAIWHSVVPKRRAIFLWNSISPTRLFSCAKSYYLSSFAVFIRCDRKHWGGRWLIGRSIRSQLSTRYYNWFMIDLCLNHTNQDASKMPSFRHVSLNEKNLPCLTNRMNHFGYFFSNFPAFRNILKSLIWFLISIFFPRFNHQTWQIDSI